MNVQTELECVEVDGKEEPPIERTKLFVKSHWNRSELVVLANEEGDSFAVNAMQLQLAITNAQSWRRP